MRKLLTVFLSVLFIVAVCTVCSNAQSSQGTISGSVFDPSGALVPGAALTATGAQTGTVYNTVSTSTGSYRFPQMQLGAYNLSATATGFQKTTLQGIVVQVNSVASQDIHLTAGAAAETVTVNAGSPTVQTESSDIGTVVADRQIIELPLSLGGQGALRSIETFVFLTPGTVGPGTAGSTTGSFQSKTAGGQNFGTETLLDGASVHRADSAAAFDELAPSVEAIQEFKVTTSTIPAEYGRTTGGVESFSIKSGTNSYHGTIFDIFQNDDLNANTYFNNLQLSDNPTDPVNRANFARPSDKKNDYGGSVGGPVSIPKLYNGKDRTFGFFEWEQYNQAQSAARVSTVPTLAVRGGDFSSQLTTTPVKGVTDCNGSPVFQGEIFDPATTSTRVDTSSGKPMTVPCRNAFPGNIIPAGRIGSVAQNVLNKFLPVPNIGDANTINNNFVFRSGFPKLNTVYSARIDQNFSQKSKGFVTYTDRDNDIRNGTPAFPLPAGGVQFQHSFAKYARVGHDYIFSPAVLNHFNVGYNRLYLPSTSGVDNKVDYPALLGIQGANGPTFPTITFTSDRGYQNNGLGYGNLTIDTVNALLISDTVTVSKGAHNIKFGPDWRQEQFSHSDRGNFSGNYDFQRYQTAAAPGNQSTGDGFASFLLGQLNETDFKITGKVPRFVQNYYAVYLQDDYKIAHNLLLNLGVRYDIDTPRHESHGNVSNFSPTTPNPGAGGLPGAMIFAGTGPGRIGGGGEFAKTWYKDIAPRLGFAYAPDRYAGRMSIRGGFGIYYGPLDYGGFGNENQQGFVALPNFNNGDQFTQAICNGLPTQGNAPCVGNGIDAGIPAYAPPPNLDPAQANGQSLGGQLNSEYIAPSYGRPGMTLNWSLELQQQLATDLILSLGYIGQSSSHLRSQLAQINDINPRYFSLGSELNGGTPATPPYTGFSGSLGQSLRPFPQYQTINTAGALENIGHSSYNAMVVKLERRFHSGLNLLASYTWSKTLTDADSALPAFATFDRAAGSVQNPYNLKDEKALSFQDTPHNFVVSYIYELPFGKGKKFLNNNSVVNAVAGGWQVGGVQRYLSGQPVSFACAPTQLGASDACNRYNQVASLRNPDPTATRGDVRKIHLFNPAALVDPNANINVPGTPFMLGNSPRVNGQFRTPVYLSEDLSVIKQVANFGDHGALQLHTDIFNIANRHHFSQPNTDPQSTQYGSYQSTFGDPRIVQFILRYTF